VIRLNYQTLLKSHPRPFNHASCMRPAITSLHRPDLWRFHLRRRKISGHTSSVGNGMMLMIWPTRCQAQQKTI